VHSKKKNSRVSPVFYFENLKTAFAGDTEVCSDRHRRRRYGCRRRHRRSRSLEKTKRNDAIGKMLVRVNKQKTDMMGKGELPCVCRLRSLYRGQVVHRAMVMSLKK
jgi:hypothetical protein